MTDPEKNAVPETETQSAALGHPALAAEHDGILEVGGDQFMRDGRGALVPLSIVKPQHQLQDEVVRKIAFYAQQLSEQIARFRGHTMDDLGAFDSILDAEYGGRARENTKGNRTYLSYDQCLKIQVQVHDTVAFGPELAVAKDLVGECISEWAEKADDKVRALVEYAFRPTKHGEISRTAIYSMLRLEIDDPRWVQAMKAVRDAIHVVSSKSYVRIYRRDATDLPWQAITLDVAKAAK